MEKEGQKIDSKPLQTIKNIENTLNQLKTKITTLQKQEVRTSNNIGKLFSSAIPIIKKKVKESEQLIKKQQSRTNSIYKEQLRNSLIRKARLEQGQQIVNSKVQMNQSKAFESMHIKEISKRNQEVIAEGRKRVFEEKRNKRNEVKESEQKSKNKIQEFHVYKKYGFTKERKEEKENMIKKIQIAKKKVQTLSIRERKMYERADKNKAIYSQLRNVSEFLYKMKPEKFMEISRKLNLTSDKQILEENVEQILYEIQQQIKNQSKQNRLSMQESKKTK